MRPCQLVVLALPMVLAALPASGCHPDHSAEVFTCPPGDTGRGAAPPKGQELWCQKLVEGHSVKDGPFIAYADGGARMIEGSYRDGMQEGEWTTWYETGQRSAIDHYHRGVQDGLHISWYANGQKAIEGNYRVGKREGVWTRWDPNGLTSKTETYADDKLIR